MDEFLLLFHSCRSKVLVGLFLYFLLRFRYRFFDAAHCLTQIGALASINWMILWIQTTEASLIFPVALLTALSIVNRVLVNHFILGMDLVIDLLLLYDLVLVLTCYPLFLWVVLWASDRTLWLLWLGPLCTLATKFASLFGKLHPWRQIQVDFGSPFCKLARDPSWLAKVSAFTEFELFVLLQLLR